MSSSSLSADEGVGACRLQVSPEALVAADSARPLDSPLGAFLNADQHSDLQLDTTDSPAADCRTSLPDSCQSTLKFVNLETVKGRIEDTIQRYIASQTDFSPHQQVLVLKAGKADEPTFRDLSIVDWQEWSELGSSSESPDVSQSCSDQSPRNVPVPAATRSRVGSSGGYQCGECGASFSAKYRLTAHVKLHDGRAAYVCSECGQQFPVKNMLSNHLLQHAGLLTCRVCGRVLSTKRSLQRHMARHTGQKDYKCTQCEKNFFDRVQLVEHLRTHTGEKPFACSLCGTAFARNSNLLAHMRIHRDEKPFRCNICSKEFRWRNNMVLHQKKHEDWASDNWSDSIPRQADVRLSDSALQSELTDLEVGSPPLHVLEQQLSAGS